MAMPGYANYLLFISVVVGIYLIFHGAYPIYSDYAILSTWKHADAVVTNYNIDLVREWYNTKGSSQVVNLSYAYPYNGNTYSGHCCGNEVASSLVQFEGEVGGTLKGDIIGSKVEIFVNPDTPSQSRVRFAILLPDYFLSILFGFLLPALIYLALTRIETSEEKALMSIEPTLKKHGFVRYTRKIFDKIPVPMVLGPAPGWSGVYRGRDFTIELFFPGGLFEVVALRFKTPNRSRAQVSIVLNNKEQMDANGLGGVYNRLDRIGMLSQIWRGAGRRGLAIMADIAANKEGMAPWVLFNIGNEQAIYILPGSILNEETFRESLEIICDTLDRLAI
jgi:hypothetical protein